MTQLTHGDRTHFTPGWAKDGRHLVYVVVQKDKLTEGEVETQIVAHDVRTGGITRVTRGPGVKTFPKVSPDGTRVAYIQGDHVLGPNALHVASLPTGGSTRVGGPDRRIFLFDWSDDEGIYVVYKDGPSMPLAELKLDTSDLRWITDRNALVGVTDVSSSRNGGVAWLQEEPSLSWSVHVARDGESPKVVLQAPKPTEIGFGSAQLVSWRTEKGYWKDGSVLLPPDFKPGTRYPLIVDAYTTRSGADWTSPLGGNQAWAAAGYVVFRPSPRAPHSWTNPWKADSDNIVAKGPRGWDVAVDEVMSGVDHLIATGLVDGNRMCIFGHSNGGNVVLEVLTRTPRFRCAVAVAPAGSNMVRLLMNDGWDPSILYDNHELEEYLDDYIAMSPAFRLHLVQTPILLAAGERDGDFYLNSLEAYHRLKRRGKDVELLRYPDQGHLFRGAALRDFWVKMSNFLERHIGSAAIASGDQGYQESAAR